MLQIIQDTLPIKMPDNILHEKQCHTIHVSFQRLYTLVFAGANDNPRLLITFKISLYNTSIKLTKAATLAFYRGGGGSRRCFRAWIFFLSRRGPVFLFLYNTFYPFLDIFFWQKFGPFRIFQKLFQPPPLIKSNGCSLRCQCHIVCINRLSSNLCH